MTHFPTYEETLEAIITELLPKWSFSQYNDRLDMLNRFWRVEKALSLFHMARLDLSLGESEIDWISVELLAMAATNRDRYAQTQLLSDIPKRKLMRMPCFPYYVSALWQLEGDHGDASGLLFENQEFVKASLILERDNARRQHLHDIYDEIGAF